ncbi:hypothetical protein F5146DRAFT_1078678 [Armillaria mellea]|nr:hypothetical protein F5146DRAFT_1078678 [Armillaria mellea]
MGMSSRGKVFNPRRVYILVSLRFGFLGWRARLIRPHVHRRMQPPFKKVDPWDIVQCLFVFWWSFLLSLFFFLSTP